MKKLDLTGQRFGRWTVLKKGESKNQNSYWLCQCDCGRVVSVMGCSLRNGRSTKCRSCASRGHQPPSSANRRLLECDGAV